MTDAAGRAEERGAVGQDGDSPGEVLYFLTNRFNMLHVLSSRLLGPLESYPKHYRDLLDLVPGHLPLLRELPGPALVEAVTSEGDNTFPVLFEIPSDRVPDSAAGRDELVLISGALPLTVVSAIHLPDEGALRDHEARPYDNVPSDTRLVSSPDCFSAGNPQADSTVLAALEATACERATADWPRIEAVRGAMAGVLAAPLARVTATAVRDFFVAMPAWRQLLRIAEPGDGSDSTPDHDPEDRLVAAVTETLDGVDKAKSFSARRFLRDLDRVLPDDGGAADSIRANLKAIREYLSGDREFVSFGSSSAGLVSAKALLLLSFRPSLSRLLEWDRQETNTSDDVFVLACAFAGRLAGVTELPVRVRILAVDDVTAEWACRVVAGASGGPEPWVEVREVETGTALLVDGAVLYEGLPPRESLIEWWQRLDQTTRDELAPRIGERLEIPRSTRIRIPEACTLVMIGQELVIEVSGPVKVEDFCDPRRVESMLEQIGSERGAEIRALAEGKVEWAVDRTDN